MLTDTKCRSAKPEAKPYKLADGHGLYLEVKPNGVKAWRYRFELAGKESTRNDPLPYQHQIQLPHPALQHRA